jgi:hypothetical protein
LVAHCGPGAPQRGEMTRSTRCLVGRCEIQKRSLACLGCRVDECAENERFRRARDCLGDFECLFE